jgi:HK97 family phage major capsid protein
MATATAKQLYAQLETKRDELENVFKTYRTESGDLDMSALDAPQRADVIKTIRERNDELTALSKQWEEARDVEEIAAKNARFMEDAARVKRPEFTDGTGVHVTGSMAPAVKTIGDAFIASEAYKSWRPGVQGYFGQDIQEFDPAKAMKATFTTSGATLTGYDRQPGLVMVGTQRLTVADLLARGQTTMNTIRYVQEDTYTNAATTVAEGATKPEATWDLSEVDAPVRKIAVTSKVTDELFADFPAVRDYINERLPFMVRQTEEDQLLNGDGNAPNLTGILSTSGIQTQATGTDNNPDAIYKAITKVRTVGFFEPDAVVIHPNNWTPIRLIKTTTGEYVWGHPAEVGPERIWGLMVDVTTAITANTALVGAFRLGAQVFYREGIRIEATNSNEDDFKKNLIALRCEMREALAVYRPKAFCKTTGLGT